MCVRNLETICRDGEGLFYREVYDNHYCSIGYNKKIDCQYQSNKTDHNDMYWCNNKDYRKYKGEN